MILTSYQPGPVPVIKDWSHRQNSLRPKPSGIWFAPHEHMDEDDTTSPLRSAWWNWCYDACHTGFTYTHKYQLQDVPMCTLEEVLRGNREGKVLHLSSEREVLQLSFRFRGATEYSLNWTKLAAVAAGILITPYQWELRHNPMCRWYYGWDMASGCIWRHPTGMRWSETTLDWDGHHN